MKDHKLVYDLIALCADQRTTPEDRKIYYQNALAIVRGQKPKKITPDTFLQFWSLYPLKVAKAPAEKAYTAALKITDHETIMSGLRWYLSNKDEKLSWAHAASWLNARRWEDGQMQESVTVPIITCEWPEWKKRISDVLGVVPVQSWFKDAEYTHGGDGALILVQDKFHADWINSRYLIELNKIFKDVIVRAK